MITDEGCPIQGFRDSFLPDPAEHLGEGRGLPLHQQPRPEDPARRPTHATTHRRQAMSTTEAATCQAAGPAAARCAASSGTAWPSGSATAPSRPSRRARAGPMPTVNIGSIMSSITGVIMLCESLRSVQAAPTATKMRAEQQDRHHEEQREPGQLRRRDGVPRSPSSSPPPDRRRCRWPPAAPRPPTPPISFPIISWNGVTEPISTSLMRLIFSSMTLLSSCGALDMTVRYISTRSDHGNARARARSTCFAALQCDRSRLAQRGRACSIGVCRVSVATSARSTRRRAEPFVDDERR